MAEYICKHCGQSFRPAASGQIYCSRDCYLASRGLTFHKLGRPITYPLAHDRAWLKAQTLAGHTYRDIAREVGCSTTLVGYYCRKYKIPPAHTPKCPRPGARPKFLSPQKEG